MAAAYEDNIGPDEPEVIQMNRNKIDLSAVVTEEPDLTPCDGPNDIPGPDLPPEEQADTPKPPDDPKERRVLIGRIKDYYRTFSKRHLAGPEWAQRIAEARSLSNAELNDLLEDIRFEIATTNTNALLMKAPMVAVAGLENALTQFTPLKLKGLTQCLEANQDWRDVMAELIIQYKSYSYTDPRYRALQIFAMTAYGVHTTNCALESTNNCLSATKVPDAIVNQSADL